MAGEIYQQNPDWVTFFREVLGVEGAARRLFPTADEFLLFEQSDEYAEIQQMVAKLRENNRAQLGHHLLINPATLPAKLARRCYHGKCKQCKHICAALDLAAMIPVIRALSGGRMWMELVFDRRQY